MIHTTRIKNGKLYVWDSLAQSWFPTERAIPKGTPEGVYQEGKLVDKPQEKFVKTDVPEQEIERPYTASSKINPSENWPITKAVRATGDALFETMASIPGTQSNQIKELQKTVKAQKQQAQDFTKGVEGYTAQQRKYGEGVDRLSSDVKSKIEDTSKVLSKATEENKSLSSFISKENELGSAQEEEQRKSHEAWVDHLKQVNAQPWARGMKTINVADSHGDASGLNSGDAEWKKHLDELAKMPVEKQAAYIESKYGKPKIAPVVAPVEPPKTMEVPYLKPKGGWSKTSMIEGVPSEQYFAEHPMMVSTEPEKPAYVKALSQPVAFTESSTPTGGYR